MERKIPTGWQAYKLGFWTPPKPDTVPQAVDALGYARFQQRGGVLFDGVLVALLWGVIASLFDASIWGGAIVAVGVMAGSFWHARRLEQRAQETLNHFDDLAARDQQELPKL